MQNISFWVRIFHDMWMGFEKVWQQPKEEAPEHRYGWPIGRPLPNFEVDNSAACTVADDLNILRFARTAGLIVFKIVLSDLGLNFTDSLHCGTHRSREAVDLRLKLAQLHTERKIFNFHEPLGDHPEDGGKGRVGWGCEWRR